MSERVFLCLLDPPFFLFEMYWALVPLAISGHEIEHPMAVVILGDLVTSTVLNLFIVPSLYLRFGRKQGLLFRRSAGSLPKAE
jgi:hypothetical protein